MKRIVTFFISALLIVLPVAAEDFDFGDLSSSDLGGDFSFDDGGSSSSALTINGDVDLSLREMIGDDNWDDLLEGSSWDYSAALELDLLYSTDKTEFSAVLDIDEDDLSEVDHIFDDLSITYYGDKATVSAGYQIVVWGKGDKLHVVDVLNPMDYTDFLNADYLDRKISQPMLKVDVPNKMNGKFEFVYVPTFEGDEYSYSGTWATSDASSLYSALETGVSNSAYATYSTYSADTGKASLLMLEYLDSHDETDELLPDTDALKYGQAAARATATFGAVDLGAMYWFGYNRQPTVYYTGSISDYIASSYSYEDFDIDYNQLQIFGLEAGGVAAGFNLRAEAAYYMTQDYDGTDDEILNPSFNYVIGFDRGIPVSNMNINIQATGSYTMFYDEISNWNDVEYSDDETFTLIVAKLSDTWDHEKIKPAVTMVYCAEDQSGQVKPEVEVDVDGNMSFGLSGTLFWGDEDSFFGYFDDNDFLELSAKFSF